MPGHRDSDESLIRSLLLNASYGMAASVRSSPGSRDFQRDFDIGMFPRIKGVRHAQEEVIVLFAVSPGCFFPSLVLRTVRPRRWRRSQPCG